MPWFSQRRAARRRYRGWWMLALYAVFVSAVASSADRAALLAQVQALVDAPQSAGSDAPHAAASTVRRPIRP